jgi:hypothetical protein
VPKLFHEGAIHPIAYATSARLVYRNLPWRRFYTNPPRCLSLLQEPHEQNILKNGLQRNMQESQLPKITVNGYPTLADFISRDRDHSASIYRCYHRLTSRNLLYLEAELFELERKQDELDAADLNGDLSATHYVRHWEALSSSDDPRCIERRKLIEEVRTKIKEYRESKESQTLNTPEIQSPLSKGLLTTKAEDALISQQTILKMIKPHSRTVEALNSWMSGDADGRGAPVLAGLSASRLDDPHDLIALHPPVEKDWLTRLVRRHFRILFVVSRSLSTSNS